MHVPPVREIPATALWLAVLGLVVIIAASVVTKTARRAAGGLS